MKAFWELSTCRPIGFGVVGPIPWTAIQQWIEVWGVEDDDEFVDLIRFLDGIYMGWVNSGKKLKRPVMVATPMTSSLFDSLFTPPSTAEH